MKITLSDGKSVGQNEKKLPLQKEVDKLKDAFGPRLINSTSSHRRRGSIDLTSTRLNVTPVTVPQEEGSSSPKDKIRYINNLPKTDEISLAEKVNDISIDKITLNGDENAT